MDARLIIMWAFFFYPNLVEGQKYSVCATAKHKNSCVQLERDDNVKCSEISDEATCLKKIDLGEINFGSVDAEAAFLGGELTSNLVAIVRTVPETGIEQFKYETIIVSTEPMESFDQLRGRNYFHPGFDNTDIPPFLLKEFEMQILKRISHCDKTFNITSEMLLHELNEFFGPSCRPGRWVADKELDKELKKKYSKLTQLCSGDDVGWQKSLRNMLKFSKAISLTTLSTVNELKNDNKIYYLCKNGTTSNDVCIWSKQPYRFLVTNKNNETNKNLPEEIKGWFTANVVSSDTNIQLSEREVKYMKNILDISGDIEMKLSFVDDQKQTLGNYLKNFRDTPKQDDANFCKRSIRWCTISSLEQEKCMWLAQVSINYGIQPVVECLQEPSELECIRGVNQKSVDFMTISADYEYAAKRFGLTSIVYPETSSEQVIRTLLLVKGDNLTHVEDLKGKKGCFPLYGDVSWLSFVNTTIRIFQPTGSCDYGKLLSDLLDHSCMPGAMEALRTAYDNIDSRMCKLCTDSDNDLTTPANTCDANGATNKYYGINGALKCLDEEGDFAVIVKNESSLLPNNVRIMCANGTLSTLDGVKVDEGCYLHVLTPSEIVTRRDYPNTKDIQLVLAECERWFASDTYAPFRLFESFNGVKDLLFKGSITSFRNAESCDRSENDQECKYIKALSTLIGRNDTCPIPAKNPQEETKGLMAPWILVLIILLVFAVVGIGAFFGFRLWRRKYAKQTSNDTRNSPEGIPLRKP